MKSWDRPKWPSKAEMRASVLCGVPRLMSLRDFLSATERRSEQISADLLEKERPMKNLVIRLPLNRPVLTVFGLVIVIASVINPAIGIMAKCQCAEPQNLQIFFARVCDNHIDGWTYNPLAMINITNALQPMGKDKALDAIVAYHQSQLPKRLKDRDLFLVLRLLFELPSGIDAPKLSLGAPSPNPDEKKKGLPIFPIMLVDDIPILLVYGYDLVGEAQLVESHLEFYRKHGIMRKALLRPTNQPFESLTKVVKSENWIYGQERQERQSTRGKRMLGRQILRLLEPEFKTNVDLAYIDDGQGKEIDLRLNQIQKELAESRLEWNPNVNQYSRPRE